MAGLLSHGAHPTAVLTGFFLMIGFMFVLKKVESMLRQRHRQLFDSWIKRPLKSGRLRGVAVTFVLTRGYRSLGDPASGQYLNGIVDYETGSVPSVNLLNNAESCACVNRSFDEALRNIRNAQIPYNPLVTNSNATARELIQHIGLPVPVPPVWAPGWSVPLRF